MKIRGSGACVIMNAPRLKVHYRTMRINGNLAKALAETALAWPLLAPARSGRMGNEQNSPFGTIKARMGATHFLMKTMPRVATEMAPHVFAYNLTRVLSIMGVRPLMAAMQG